METKLPPPYAHSKELNSSIREETPSELHSYLHILRNRKGSLLGFILAGLLIAFFVNLTQKPLYQASAELILVPREASKGPGPAGTASIFSDPTFLLTQERIIRGTRLANKVIEKLETAENREPLLRALSVKPSRRRKETSVFSEKERQSLIGALQRWVWLQQLERGARILAVVTRAYDPQVAALVANTVAETYVEINYSSHVESFKQSFGMYSKSLAEIRERIKTSEIASQKIESEIRLLEALKVYEQKHPLVIQLRREIPELTQRLRQGVQNLDTMKVGQQKNLTPLLLRPFTELEELQKNETDLHTLKPLLEQELTSYREMYNSFVRKLQEIEVSGGGSVWVDAEVVEPASVPHKPMRPNKPLNLMIGLILGLLLGVSFTFFQEYLDSSIKSLEDVRNYLRLFPLGMIPQIRSEVTSEKGKEEKEGSPVSVRRYWMTDDPEIPLYISEAYRIVRTNLAFGSLDRSLKALQITSAVKGEGKTTTAANLGISLALGGSKTLLVDGDLRRPSLHHALGLEGPDWGLSDSLKNGGSWESVVRPTRVQNLFLISAGTLSASPAELLASKRMADFIEGVKQNFDTIIVDSPPVISVADSAIIASRVDGTILVFRSGFIPRHLCLQAKNALESVQGKVIGCILNHAQTQHQPYYYDRYYHQYGRYEGTPSKSSSGDGEDSSEKGSWSLQRLETLRELLGILVEQGWRRLGERLKRKAADKESKPPLATV